MPRNMLPLITHLIDSIEADQTGRGNLALQFFGENRGTIDRDAFTSQAEMLEPLGLLPPPGTAISCGTTATALCYVFGKCSPFANEVNVQQLRGVIQDGKSRVIRIDQESHSYVIEQFETSAGPAMGNVYQSNVAVLSNGELGITMYKYLHEHTNPVNLDQHLQNIALLADQSIPKDRRQEVYLQMYTVPTYLRNPEVKPPKIEDALTSTGRYLLSVKKLTYQDFRSPDVLAGVQRILTFSNLGRMAAAQQIYYDCSP
ncbi:MAG TPA: hypothetical protein VHM70_13380 [Polyangiaceae bacterium]|jgi:hypothetical protein|nr:hypothetical protein [Polyangiaceae bacterium]